MLVARGASADSSGSGRIAIQIAHELAVAHTANHAVHADHKQVAENTRAADVGVKTVEQVHDVIHATGSYQEADCDPDSHTGAHNGLPGIAGEDARNLLADHTVLADCAVLHVIQLPPYQSR